MALFNFSCLRDRGVEDVELWLEETEGHLASEDFGKVVSRYDVWQIVDNSVFRI